MPTPATVHAGTASHARPHDGATTSRPGHADGERGEPDAQQGRPGQVRAAALPRRRRGPAQRGRDERDARGRQRPAVRRGQHQRQVGVPGEEHAGDQPAGRDDGRDAAARPGRPGGEQPAQRGHQHGERAAATAATQRSGVLARPAHRGDPERGTGSGDDEAASGPRRRAGAAQPTHARDHQGERDRDERDEPEEHPVPRELLGDQRRHRRADQGRQHPRRRDEPEHRRPGPLRVDRRDRDVDRDELGPRARPLQDPADQELGQRARGAGDDQPGGEHQRRDEQRGPGPGDVAPAPAQHRAQHGRGEERGEGPAVGRHGAEVGDHGGHGGADPHRLEGGDQREQDQADGGGPPAGAEQGGPRRFGDVGRSGAVAGAVGSVMAPCCNLDQGAGQPESARGGDGVRLRRVIGGGRPAPDGWPMPRAGWPVRHSVVNSTRAGWCNAAPLERRVAGRHPRHARSSRVG